LINIHAKFQLIMTTGTCNTRNITWHFRLVELTSEWSKSKNFSAVPTILLPLTSVSYQNAGELSGYEHLILTPDGWTDGH